MIIDELLIGGELQESSKRAVVNTLKRMDEVGTVLTLGDSSFVLY